MTDVTEQPINKNKEDLLTYYLRCEATDIAVIIETWLTDSDMDAIWVESNGLKKDGYQISAINRIGMKGCGLALIYGKNVTLTVVDQKQHRSLSEHTGGSPLELRLCIYSAYTIHHIQ